MWRACELARARMIIAGLAPARTPAVSAATRKLSVNTFARLRPPPWHLEAAHDGEPFPDQGCILGEACTVTRRRGLVEHPHRPSPPVHRSFPFAVVLSHIFGDCLEGHDLHPCRLDDATRSTRSVQQHAERANEGDFVIGVVPERRGGERLHSIQDERNSLVGVFRDAANRHRGKVASLRTRIDRLQHAPRFCVHVMYLATTLKDRFATVGASGKCLFLATATFHGRAAIQSPSERRGHSASRAYRSGFMSPRPST